MDEKITDVLKRLDKEVNTQPAAYAPPRVREQKLDANLLDASDASAQTIMHAIEEVEKKVAALRQNAEHGIASMKSWTNEFANQLAEIHEHCNRLTSTVNESVERITQIGKKPIDGVPQQQVLPDQRQPPREAYLKDINSGRTQSGDMM
jgi:hypothetical protein